MGARMELPNIGVIGVGAMGASHARVLSSLTHLCRLSGVYDEDGAVSREVAANHRTTAVGRLDELLARVDAVVIAVPTSAHYEIACAAIELGKHVLIEKPIAATSIQGRDLVSRARARGVVLQVGHIERFNPAVALLPQILADKQIVALDFHRMSPYDSRIFDADVVSDLMIHDIDILHNLLPVPHLRTESAGTAPRSGLLADYATATLIHVGGVIANLTASRVTEQKIRTLCITTLEAFIELDYLERRILISRATHPHYSGSDSAYRQENIIEKVYVPNREPLVAEVESFLECVRTGERPLVTGEDGVAALETVERIQFSLYQQPVTGDLPPAGLRQSDDRPRRKASGR